MGNKPAEKSRRPNFSEDEIQCMKEEISKHNELIKSKFSDRVTQEKKQAVWKEITTKVNSHTTCIRSVTEVQKNWKNLTSEAKKAIATKMSKNTARKTGGGDPEDELTGGEEHMLNLIGKESVLGIDEGIDSSLNNKRRRRLSDNSNCSFEADSFLVGLNRSRSPTPSILENSHRQSTIDLDESVTQSKKRRTSAGGSPSASTWVSDPISSIGTPKSFAGQKKRLKGSVEEELLAVQKDVLSSMADIQENMYLQRKDSKSIGENICSMMERIAQSGESTAETLKQLVELKKQQLKIAEENLALKKIKMSGESYQIVLATPDNSQNTFLEPNL